MTIDLPVSREIVVINDGSSDGTREVLDALPDRGDIVRIFHAERNAGKGAAIRLGLRHARGTIVAIQDADLELDPAQLAALVAPILSGGTKVVYGSRFLAGRPDAPWLTVVANRTLTLTTNLLFGARITDMETCYKIMRAGGGPRARTRVEPIRHRAGDHRQAAPRRPPHPGTPGALHAAPARRRQEDRLARRLPRPAGTGRLPIRRLAPADVREGLIP